MNNFTKTEDEIMAILWEIKKGFPKEILSRMTKELPYNTILSTIRKLEKEGYLGFVKFGKSHQYYPKLKKKEYSKSIFKKLFHSYLGGSKEQLLSFF